MISSRKASAQHRKQLSAQQHCYVPPFHRHLCKASFLSCPLCVLSVAPRLHGAERLAIRPGQVSWPISLVINDPQYSNNCTTIWRVLKLLLINFFRRTFWCTTFRDGLQYLGSQGGQLSNLVVFGRITHGQTERNCPAFHIKDRSFDLEARNG